MRRVSQRVAGELRYGRELMPQYAGQTVRVAYVYYHTANRKPVSIWHIDGIIWKFDETGSIEAHMWEGNQRAVDALQWDDEPRREDKVVMFPRRYRKTVSDEEFWWTPSIADINRMIRAIWPETRPSRKD